MYSHTSLIGIHIPACKQNVIVRCNDRNFVSPVLVTMCTSIKVYLLLQVNVCDLLYSQSMESAGVLKLYFRSIERNKIQYIPFIGDGDSSSYNLVCVVQPYGPTVYIPKVDCISHVTKRMGTNLRSLVRDHKGKLIKCNNLA